MSRVTAALLMLALLSLAATSEAAIDAGGVIRLYVEKHGRGDVEPEAEVQLKLASKRVGRTKGVVRIEGRYYRSDLYIKDAYLDHKA